MCKADQVEMQKEEVKVDETGSRIRISNVWYDVGQFIYLEDNSLQYKIEKSLNKFIQRRTETQRCILNIGVSQLHIKEITTTPGTLSRL